MKNNPSQDDIRDIAQMSCSIFKEVDKIFEGNENTICFVSLVNAVSVLLNEIYICDSEEEKIDKFYKMLKKICEREKKN
jgi:hypothetical protein